MMLVSVVAFVAMSAAQGGEAATTAVPNPVPPAKEKKVCRTDNLIGSIIPKRVCKTRTEWAAQSGTKRAEPIDPQAKPAQPASSGSNN
jgi:hypothetical protein